MAKSEKNKPPVNIEAFKYKDRRANIPTKELRDFVVKDEASPKTILYPRDPSLDPQLVWKGKDEQDAQDLEVPSVRRQIKASQPSWTSLPILTASSLRKWWSSTSMSRTGPTA